MTGVQYMVADRGGNVFALPLREVLRVAMSPRITEAPLMPAGYVGVIDFEGEAVPVWDPFPDSADAMWGATVIVADSLGGRVGFLSDAPPRVASAENGADSDAVAQQERAGVVPPGAEWGEFVQVGEAAVPVLSPSRFGA